MTSNIMSNSVWTEVKLPVVIRGFQQHKLKEKLTKVHITDTGHLRQARTDRVVAAAGIRALLLDHQRLRRAARRERDA